MPKHVVTYKNTSFLPGEGVKKERLIGEKKRLPFHPDFLVIHIFAQTFSHNVDLQ